MTEKELRQRYPGLDARTAAHVYATLRKIDWQHLQKLAASWCRACPRRGSIEGPPCDWCPLRPLSLDAGILAAQARSAQRDKDYLESLPIENPDRRSGPGGARGDAQRLQASLTPPGENPEG